MLIELGKHRGDFDELIGAGQLWPNACRQRLGNARTSFQEASLKQVRGSRPTVGAAEANLASDVWEFVRATEGIFVLCEVEQLVDRPF